MKKLVCIIILFLAFNNNSFSAGNSSSSDSGSEYTKAENLIKSAKKYEKKGKLKKAQKRYSKAQKLLLKYNKDKPLQADTLNYLGFTTRKLGDFKKRGRILFTRTTD
jgi:tetratricopeptide (TPR) repeat protein